MSRFSIFEIWLLNKERSTSLVRVSSPVIWVMRLNDRSSHVRLVWRRELDEGKRGGSGAVRRHEASRKTQCAIADVRVGVRSLGLAWQGYWPSVHAVGSTRLTHRSDPAGHCTVQAGGLPAFLNARPVRVSRQRTKCPRFSIFVTWLLSICSFVRLSSPRKLSMQARFLKLNAKHSTSLNGMVRFLLAAVSGSPPWICGEAAKRRAEVRPCPPGSRHPRRPRDSVCCKNDLHLNALSC